MLAMCAIDGVMLIVAAAPPVGAAVRGNFHHLVQYMTIYIPHVALQTGAAYLFGYLIYRQEKRNTAAQDVRSLVLYANDEDVGDEEDDDVTDDTPSEGLAVAPKSSWWLGCRQYQKAGSDDVCDRFRFVGKCRYTVYADGIFAIAATFGVRAHHSNSPWQPL
jgi:hypothetical protein